MNKAAHMLETFKKRLGSVKEKAEESVGMVVETVEIAGSAFGMAYANERWGKTVVGTGGEIQVAGLPVDLGGAIALKGLGLYLGASNKQASHMQAIGNGLLASYGVRIGGKLGRTAKTKGSTTAGHLGEGSTAGYYNQAAYEMSGDGRGVG